MARNWPAEMCESNSRFAWRRWREAPDEGRRDVGSLH
jgi:hypothetical protein